MPAGEGWNGHPEHEWETDTNVVALRERLVQLFFQMVRTDSREKILSLAEAHRSLIDDLVEKDPEDHSRVMDLLKRLPLQTRDIRSGKGERALAYSQLLLWYDVGYTEYAEVVFRRWLGVDGGFPLGSWKDVKLFSEFVKWIAPERKGAKHPLVLYGIHLLADQLRKDQHSANPSLAAKWTPGEKCKRFAWIFRAVADELFPPSSHIEAGKEPKEARASRHRKLRKLLSGLNQKIRTTEVMMCGGRWSEIDFTRVSSVTMQKHKRAFYNLPKSKIIIRKGKFVSTKFDDKTPADDGTTPERSEAEDRRMCATNLRSHVDKSAKGEVEVKAKNTSLFDLIRDAIKCVSKSADDDERKILEEQWKSNRSVNRPGLPPMIPMVDVSGSMAHPNFIPLYNAMGLGLRASEMTHPAFRNRIMTFSESPSWVALPEKAGFVERIRILRSAPWGMNTNFYKALDLILDTMVSSSIPPEEAKGMVLAVFSDMQIDAASKQTTSARLSMHAEIKRRYNAAGYEPPHILYWNLNGTSGFPNVSTEMNTTMVSGFNPALLNAFETKGIEELSTMTPFAFVEEILRKYHLEVDALERAEAKLSALFDEIEEVLPNRLEDRAREQGQEQGEGEEDAKGEAVEVSLDKEKEVVAEFLHCHSPSSEDRTSARSCCADFC